MSTYQGHLSDGSSVQKHSAGGLYPYIIFAKQCDGVLLYGVLTPKGEETLYIRYDWAVQYAGFLKAADSKKAH